MMEEVAGWVAPVATTIAALMVAVNKGARLTGYGFIVFSIGSIAWGIVGLASGQMNLVWQNAVLLVINLIGVWQWLGLRVRYSKGASVAVQESARLGSVRARLSAIGGSLGRAFRPAPSSDLDPLLKQLDREPAARERAG